MTTIARTARAALAVAALGLATAGIASAATQPSPFASTSARAAATPLIHGAHFRPHAGGCMRGCVI